MLIMCPRVLCTHVFMACIILEAELLSRLVAMLSFLRILLYTHLCVFVCMCCAMVCVERVQLVGASSFLPYVFWAPNLDHPAWSQVPLPVEPFC